MTPADRRIEQAGGITDARLAELIELCDSGDAFADWTAAETERDTVQALRELQQRRSVPIVRGELRADLEQARAELLREAADDCEDCANTLLNDAPIMGATKEARYRKEAAATVVRACALRAWADSISPIVSRYEHESGDCSPGP